MQKSVQHFKAMSAMLLLAIIVALLTRNLYGNAFFTHTKGVVISFFAFLSVDVIRWIIRTTPKNAEEQTKGEEIGWTVAFLLFVACFLWRNWEQYSFWQGWMITAICAVSIIGLAIRLYNRWDADCVRWGTWSVCCFIVTFSILGCIVFWHPMTLEKAEELVIAETGDDSFTFRYIDNGSTMINHYAAEAPLGYYIFNQKQEDGTYGTYETGRAVVYLGDVQEAYRNPRDLLLNQ